jgi:hypothetical protein
VDDHPRVAPARESPGCKRLPRLRVRMTPQPTVHERWKAIPGPMQQPAAVVMGATVGGSRGFPSGFSADGAQAGESRLGRIVVKPSRGRGAAGSGVALWI